MAVVNGFVVRTVEEKLAENPPPFENHRRPVDYTFKICTECERKAVIRKDVSRCQFCIDGVPRVEDQLKANPDTAERYTSSYKYMPGLKWIRRANGITLKDLSELTGYPLGTISAWENLRQSTSPVRRRRLARALSCREEDLLEE